MRCLTFWLSAPTQLQPMMGMEGKKETTKRSKYLMPAKEGVNNIMWLQQHQRKGEFRVSLQKRGCNYAQLDMIGAFLLL